MIRAVYFLLLATSACPAENFLPVFNIQERPLEIESGSGQATFPLGDYFIAEEIDDQVVRFTAEYDDGTGTVSKNLDMALFRDRTPGTRANFLKYVSDGDYVDSFIHRSVPGFVVQGGGFGFSPTGVVAVPTDAPIVNEPGISNTAGTISMAKLGGDPDSATSQFFISNGANSANLDYQNGGFTVFARMTRETFPNARLFNNPAEFPRLNFGSPLNETPIHKSFPEPVPRSKFISFPSVGLAPLPTGQAATAPTLSFSLTTPPASTFATSSITGTNLQITQTGITRGLGEFVVTATDPAGNQVTGKMSVRIGDTYATWRAANFTGPDLSDDSISGPSADPDGNGITNLQIFAQGLDLTETVSPLIVRNPSDVRVTYFEQADSLRTRVVIERSTTLNADWQEIEAATVSRIPTGKTNQEAVTVSLAPSGTKSFYRVRFDLVP